MTPHVLGCDGRDAVAGVDRYLCRACMRNVTWTSVVLGGVGVVGLVAMLRVLHWLGWWVL